MSSTNNRFGLSLKDCFDIEDEIPPNTRFEDMTDEQIYAWNRVEFYGWNGYDFDTWADDSEKNEAQS